MNINEHAYKVVKGFKKSLSKEQKKALNKENYEELQILIEAALGSATEIALHDCAKANEKLALKMRKRAKIIECLEQ